MGKKSRRVPAGATPTHATPANKIDTLVAWMDGDALIKIMGIWNAAARDGKVKVEAMTPVLEELDDGTNCWVVKARP